VDTAGEQMHNGSMREPLRSSVNLSIKEVPEQLAEALRERARANHRSIQGELMAMLETYVGARPFNARRLLGQVRAVGLRTPDESVQMIRDDRDAR
jgi:plasmid stability protein